MSLRFSHRKTASQETLLHKRVKSTRAGYRRSARKGTVVTTPKKGFKVCVCGGAGGIGQ
eukprot:symbB.v1.2.041608.t1/scaffold8399.1/size6513/1